MGVTLAAETAARARFPVCDIDRARPPTLKKLGLDFRRRYVVLLLPKGLNYANQGVSTAGDAPPRLACVRAALPSVLRGRRGDRAGAGRFGYPHPMIVGL